MKRLLLSIALLLVLVYPAGAQIATLPVVTSTAYEPSHVLKSGAGTLWSFTINNHAATGMYIMFFNATSVPSNGAVTPVYCDVVSPLASGTDGQVTKQLLGGMSFSTGLSVAFSTNAAGCSTLTVDVSNDGWFWAQVQ